MTTGRNAVVPLYLVADESNSMGPFMGELNAGLTGLHEAMLAEPMAAAKLRLSVVGFSSGVVPRLRLADVRVTPKMPVFTPRSGTDYGRVFADLRHRIRDDVSLLHAQRHTVLRPVVFFLSDGQPSDRRWRKAHRMLLDRATFPAAPNVVACGVGTVDAATIIAVASRREFAYVSIAGAAVGRAVVDFCVALTRSAILTGRALVSPNPALVVSAPTSFRLAVDLV